MRTILTSKNDAVLAVWARWPQLSGAGFAWLTEHGWLNTTAGGELEIMEGWTEDTVVIG